MIILALGSAIFETIKILKLKLKLKNCRLHFSNYNLRLIHYSDVIMSAMASHITSVSIVCLTVCSGADQRKHQARRHCPYEGNPSVTGGFPHKGPMTRQMFPFNDVFVYLCFLAVYHMWYPHCFVLFCFVVAIFSYLNVSKWPIYPNRPGLISLKDMRKIDWYSSENHVCSTFVKYFCCLFILCTYSRINGVKLVPLLTLLSNTLNRVAEKCVNRDVYCMLFLVCAYHS